MARASLSTASIHVPPRGPAAVVRPRAVPASVASKQRHLETVIGDAEIRTLVQLIEYDGLAAIAEAIGISQLTLLRVTAGMMGRCHARTRHAVRRFFALSDPG